MGTVEVTNLDIANGGDDGLTLDEKNYFVQHKENNEESSSVEQGYSTSENSKEDFGFINTDDPFPEDPNADPDDKNFTFRATLVGCVLGGVIAASNVYLGLKTGWTFGASLFGSIFGYAILKPMSKALPKYLGGGYFGPKENVCCQSAATAAGSLGLLFTSGFPAAYQLGLLSSPKEDFGRLVTFTACCAFYGMFFAIPLRKYYILKLKLVFPSGVAAAYTIRSLHVGKDAEANARKKTKCLIVAFCVAITWRVVSEYAPGLLWDWHIFWGLYKAGWQGIIEAENWGWVWEWTPAFIGVGMLMGLNSGVSVFGGSFLAWAIIGPAIVATGKAVGTAVSPEFPGYISYASLVMDDPINAPSPRYWMIWPGTMMLLCGSFAEVGCNYKTVYVAFKSMMEPLARLINKPMSAIAEEDMIYDPIPKSQQVPQWMWMGGVVLSTFFTCLVLGLQFQQNVGITLLSIIFAFLFSMIGAECTGRTNITPVTSLGNASQLIFGGVAKGVGQAPVQNQLLNLLAGMVTLGASEQSADMMSDLKTAHLLGASPRAQLYAQLFGAIVSIFMSVLMYILFSAAYPCINSLSGQATCTFPVPDVGAWRAIATAITAPTLPIPPSSGYVSIAFGLIAIIVTVIKYFYIPSRYHHFVPNFNAIGVAFIMYVTTFPTAMLFGSLVAFVWKRKFPSNYVMYCYAVAAGFIAGEGLGGIVNAILQIAGVSGAVFGTAVGCPGNTYCG
ncbi:hypothetical protein BZG36_05084 [Bifiguratus adelaidae]|uniref:OPT family oligopeptide transporter n=1 Tax=Bifiguratus adelaidae TaxID=1938954 RepID=A0A261XUK8_9FUNG|nr:hypothetical protein BZG36_05084 [Bifiguratus adelaidae]